MRLVWLSVVTAVVFGAPPLAHAAESADDANEFFEARVRPVLAGTCFACHGGEKTNGGLRVDSRDALLTGGETGPAVVPGKPDESILILAIRRHDDYSPMPPDEPLADATVRDFETWVRAGAAWPEDVAADGRAFAAGRHWAYQPVREVTPPDVDDEWSSHPIDRFISAAWKEHGLRPVGPAPKQALVRRLYFDLIGLPPTPEEVDAFLEDTSDSAVADLVDRLLASPHYGERWGRHWLDVARYSDTAGDNADYPVPELYRYRDYVIDAMNADKPFDAFIREQLAGDILAKEAGTPPDRYAEMVAATGFLALSRRYGTGPYEMWHLTMEDCITTVGRAFLGVNFRCARCHDHKFDPITNQDYYALYGIFASTQFPWAGAEELTSQSRPREHFPPLLPPEEAGPRLEAHQERVAQAEGRIEQLKSEKQENEKQLQAKIDELAAAIAASSETGVATVDSQKQLDALKAEVEEKRKASDEEIKRLEREVVLLKRPGLPVDVPGAYAVSEGTPQDVQVQYRGDEKDLREKVARGAPVFLCREGLQVPPSSSGRRELADWIASADNPLTARVIVNRVWHYHFGKGLVATPSDFGVRGAKPTHPELLDWLAGWFVDHGWSLKQLHRLILSSRTYQLAAESDAEFAKIDPANRYLWRYDRRRLDAESIRDCLLAVSGTLDESRPGRQPFPGFDQWGWSQANPFRAVYPSQHRSVYLMTQRIQRHPFLALFDGPDPNESTGRRPSSTVALQALYFLNNQQPRDVAAAFAERILGSAADTEERIRFAFRTAYARDPSAEESELMTEFVRAYRAHLRSLDMEGDVAERKAWAALAQNVLASNEFVYID